MKTKKLCLLLLVILPIILLNVTGCTTVEQTIYLGDVKANGPIIPPPTHININKKEGGVTISPKFSFVTTNKLKGTTDDGFYSPYELQDGNIYQANPENLLWNFSDYTFGVDIDIKASRVFSIFSGLNISKGENNNLTGGYFGIGLHTDTENPCTRIDFGLNIQEFDYLAVTIVETKETITFIKTTRNEYTSIYEDKGQSVNVNPFFTITLNSNFDFPKINYFGTIGFFTQSILNFKPGETHYNSFIPPLYVSSTVDKRANYTGYFVFLNPGIAFSLGQKTRLIVSPKFLFDASSSGEFFAAPVLQMDFQL